MSYTLRELQLCELEVLKSIKSVCDKHQIRYYLSSGTLLGAVRHQGFIPWDDDIDVEMPYPDYLRFLEVAQAELGEDFFLQNYDTDPYYYFAYSRVRKNGTTMMREWEKDIPSHYGVWVDIFPMAYVGGTLDYRIKRLLLSCRTFLRMHEDLFSLSQEWLVSQSSAFMVMLVKVARSLPESARYKICKAIEKYIFRSREKAYLSNVWVNITRRIPKESFEPATELLFEGERFSAPKDYDTYLRIAYGDYMTPPPEDKRSGGHGDLHVDLHHSWKPGEELPEVLRENTI